jgi:carbonic anhydrase
MLKTKTAIFLITALLAAHPVRADEHGTVAGSHDEARQAKAIVRHLLAGNAGFMKRHGPEHFEPFVGSQHPKATVVSCCDSRVQMQAIDATPDNELFVVRDIGNQIATAEGSVEYGVHHLHTPVLLIIGHVRCGAIKAATGDYSQESASIRRELDTLQITKGGDILANVRLNVNHQVTAAVGKFAAEVKEGKLTVVGAVYDFANDLQQGHGKLVVINVNSDTSAEAVKTLAGE